MKRSNWKSPLKNNKSGNPIRRRYLTESPNRDYSMNLLPIRIIPLIILLACVVASQTPEELMAQGAPSSTDEIIYLPDTRNKKEETIKGQIQEESPGGIKVKTEKSGQYLL